MTGPIRLRFGGYASPSSGFSLAAARFKELVESATQGQVAVDVFWNVLDFGYKADELVEMTDCGVLAGCYMSTTYLAALSPRLAIFDLPFLVTDREQALALLDGPLGFELAREVEGASGLKHLGYWESGFRHLTNSRRPVRSPADLAGLRIRIQASALIERAFTLLGAEPVIVDVSELIPALIAGRVHGQENPLENIWSFGLHRYTPHLTLSGHMYAVRSMLLNRAWFGALPEELQAAVEQAGRQVTLEQRVLAQRRDGELRARLEADSIQTVELTAEERAAFRQAVEPLYAETAATFGQDPRELVLSPAQP